MKKFNSEDVPAFTGSRYPAPFDEPCRERRTKRLAAHVELTDFGVNLVTLPPGAWSSQRHWHSHEDEFVFVLSGELTLVTDAGSEILRAGDCAGFKAGDKDGHHLQNNSAADASFLVVGSRRDEDYGEYPDIDMRFNSERYTAAGKPVFTRKNGEPYDV